MTAVTDEVGHYGVMIAEVVAGLAPVTGGRYLDATFGSGGHTRALLEATNPDGQVLGLDRDPDALVRGGFLSDRYGGRLHLYEHPFARLTLALDRHGWNEINGAVFDLGVSSQQLDSAHRGFSFRFDGPLDMRMDQGKETVATAADLVNQLGEWELARLFFELGEEPRAKKAARAIIAARSKERLTSTRQLAELLEGTLPPPRPGLHPATRVFQALRMMVNQELQQLEEGLRGALERLVEGGRIAVISFHSLEDRAVKRAFTARAVAPKVAGPMRLMRQLPETVPMYTLVTRKPLTPSPDEIRRNPRSRSAKLRIIQRGGRVPSRMA
ncbi:MAG: 16S rRNA (cytosine(1402)-N(4))-methyltransferase RsmH [Magnetococcales bacterium]|nr:16S rRNA (cytosine(1402)-N(4))-methyltransferase RsmH [Magnetococcales bacterium]MBF0421352.1 16S rRNA (cytosine(1402)-N(4))-methyltransferase RsmH [Magnetococcales bacterium]